MDGILVPEPPVDRVRVRAADIERDSRAAKHWTGATVIHRHLRFQNTHALRPHENADVAGGIRAVRQIDLVRDLVLQSVLPHVTQLMQDLVRWTCWETI